MKPFGSVGDEYAAQVDPLARDVVASGQRGRILRNRPTADSLVWGRFRR